jgi:hypothetical protein
MRLYEFADAEAQLALLRTIIDNTWKAIAQQGQQQKINFAQRRPMPKPKTKLRPKKQGKVKGLRIPSVPVTSATKPIAPLAKQTPPPYKKPTPSTTTTIKPLASANPQLKQQPTSTANTLKQTSTPYPKPVASTPIKPQIGLKTGYYGKNIGAFEKDDDGDDMHSKKGFTTLKK